MSDTAFPSAVRSTGPEEDAIIQFREEAFKREPWLELDVPFLQWLLVPNFDGHTFDCDAMRLETAGLQQVLISRTA